MDFNFDANSISSVSSIDPAGSTITITGTGALIVPIGTTAQAPSVTAGALRFNTDTSLIDFYNGATWKTTQVTNTSITNISAVTGSGMMAQTATGTYALRTIAGAAGNIVVTNGDGVAGAPTIGLATAGTAGTYAQVTTDAYGRVTSGSATQAWSTITSTPTTLAGYGITNAVLNAGNGVSVAAGTFATRPVAGTAGRFYFATDTLAQYYDNGAAWVLDSPALTGDVTTSAGSTAVTLASSGVTAGAYGSASQYATFTVDAKGRITSAANVAVPSASISVTGGDLTMSGATGTAITNATLATSGVTAGTYGNAGAAAQVIVDAKGRVTSAANVTITPAAIGAIATSALGAVNGVATLDATGKLTDTQIPSALVGALVYQGTWNASTNTPTITSGAGTKGQYYKVSVAGTTTIDGYNKWTVGDMIVYNGTTWDAIDGLTTEVTSVFGRVGAVTATLASADFANQGTATTVLIGNAAGNPSWGAVNLSSMASGTLQAGQFPALTGDITTTAGSIATTLATTAVTAGSYGAAGSVATFTVDSKGRLTAAANVAIPNTVALTGDITATGTTSGSVAATLASSGVTAGTYGSSTTVPQFVVDAKGRVTSAANVSIASSISVTGGDLTLSGTVGSAITNATLATSGVTAGVYGSGTQIPQITVDTKGRVTVGANVALTAANAGAVANAGTVPSFQSGTFAGMPAAGTAGRMYVTSDTSVVYRDSGTAWVAVGKAPVLYTENPSSPTANTVSGTNATAIGSANTAGGTFALATGSGASTPNYGAMVHANGSFTNPGDAQSGKYVLRAITTNATVTEVFADGASARIVLPNNSAYAYIARVVGRRTDTTGSIAGFEIKGVIARDATAASTAQVGTRSKTTLTAPSGWNAEVFADATAGALTFKVTGQAASTVRWVVTVETTEVSN
jgi:hypothetical protein